MQDIQVDTTDVMRHTTDVIDMVGDATTVMQLPEKHGINYFADLRMTFRQNFFLQHCFRNKFGIGLG
jgi:hypothetical protein